MLNKSNMEKSFSLSIYIDIAFRDKLELFSIPICARFLHLILINVHLLWINLSNSLSNALQQIP